MIPYVKMNDGSIVISLHDGPVTIDQYTINYRVILRRLELQDITSDEVTDLLSEPCPDGLFYAYSFNGLLIIRHIDREYNETLTDPTGTTFNLPSSDLTQLLGTYTSRKALIDDFPEYFI